MQSVLGLNSQMTDVFRIRKELQKAYFDKLNTSGSVGCIMGVEITEKMFTNEELLGIICIIGDELDCLRSQLGKYVFSPFDANLTLRKGE